ncbi:MAG: ISAzo13 family transposase [Mangrovibacterium sp.]|nr:ISAzo13 family transposase [Mangrovibacterium sp.]
MTKEKIINQVSSKYQQIVPYLDEKTKRIWCAVEAQSMNRGGVSFVSQSTGLSRTTIYQGIQELNSPLPGKGDVKTNQRLRKIGGGRKRLIGKYPVLLKDLEILLEPYVRGDPESPLLWTCKSTYNLARELQNKGYKVSQRTMCDLLADMGYSLQSNRKSKEGGEHPDRNGQFEYIYQKVKFFQQQNLPVISVDTKKKEAIGEYKNTGKEYRPKGEPEQVKGHDFIDKKAGKVSPYGIYDQTRNIGFVNVGIDHDTAEFAVESIRRWWIEMGSLIYKNALQLLINADCGGSNGYRNKLWKVALQELANQTGLTIHVSHFPPGTSKWNKIEHRMFCHITNNWRGKPLTSREVVVNLIANTTTRKGLKINATLDENTYEKGKKITDDELSKLNIYQFGFHGEWNYKIKPNE